MKMVTKLRGSPSCEFIENQFWQSHISSSSGGGTRSSRYSLSKVDAENNVKAAAKEDEDEKFETLEELSDTLSRIVRKERTTIEKMNRQEFDTDENSLRSFDLRGHELHLIRFIYPGPIKGTARMMALSILTESMANCTKFDDFVPLLKLFDFVVSSDPLSDLIELNQVLAELVEVRLLIEAT